MEFIDNRSYLCIFLFEIEMTTFSDGETFHFDKVEFWLSESN